MHIDQGRLFWAFVRFNAIASFLLVCLAQMEESAFAQPKVLEIKVVDPNDKPISNAEIEVFSWSGRLDPAEVRGKADHNGLFRCDNFKIDSYFYVVVRHPEFAPASDGTSSTETGKQSLTIRLAPSASNFVRVVSPEGAPVEGAEVTRMEYSSRLTQGRSFASQAFFRIMMQNDGKDFRSQKDGRLQLPPIPMDAELSLTVAHPDWAVGKLPHSVKLGELHNHTIQMVKGTQVEARFAGSPETISKLQSESIDIGTFDRKNSLFHSFPLTGSAIQFTLLPGRYDSLHLRSKDVMITPQLPSSNLLAEFWNIPEGDRIFKTFVVRELLPVIGRVVTQDGKPVSGVDIGIESENLYVDETGAQQTVKEHPTTFDLVQTGPDGIFRTKLPKGKTMLEVFWQTGYYSIPEQSEINFQGESELPDYVVIKKPTIQGQTLDAEGKPVANAIVRFLNDSESEYVYSDANGNFAMPVKALAYDQAKKERSFLLELEAFDLKSNLCSIQTVDIRDDEAVSSCKLRMTHQPISWLMDQIRHRNEERLKLIVANSNFMKEETENGSRSESDLAAPELSSGTWLNTSLQSLKELQGKYVLLDFWFIGCGPCEREIPNLKFLHQAFTNEDFAVVSVHRSEQSIETVKQFADSKEMSYPIVVDSIDESITKAYRPLGVEGYPSYFLVGPDGKIDTKTRIRGNMLEVVREKMLLLKAARHAE